MFKPSGKVYTDFEVRNYTETLTILKSYEQLTAWFVATALVLNVAAHMMEPFVAECRPACPMVVAPAKLLDANVARCRASAPSVEEAREDEDEDTVTMWLPAHWEVMAVAFVARVSVPLPTAMKPTEADPVARRKVFRR